MPDQRSLADAGRRWAHANVCAADTKLFDLAEARRLGARGQRVYAALVHEAYAAGCTLTARHIECLVAKEAKLRANMAINHSLHENRQLLFAMCRMAIQTERHLRTHERFDCDARSKAVQQLYQLVRRLEQHAAKYVWLLEDVYTIVTRAIGTMAAMGDVSGLRETRARVLYNHALFICNCVGGAAEQAQAKYERALRLCQGEAWPPDNAADVDDFDTLHAAVAARLAALLFDRAKACIEARPDAAIALCQKAVGVVAKVGLPKNLMRLCEAHLLLIDLLLQAGRYSQALLHLYSVQPEITHAHQHAFVRLRCKHFLQKGIAYYNLHDIGRALQRLRMAHALCQRHALTEFLGEVLVYLGKTYAQRPDGYAKSLNAYLAARRFCRMNDERKRYKHTNYLMAQLQFDQTAAEFKRMLKSADYCEYYRLMEWKMRLRPYWLGHRAGTDANANANANNNADANADVDANSGQPTDAAAAADAAVAAVAAVEEPQLPQLLRQRLRPPQQPLLPDGSARTSAAAVQCLMNEEYARCMDMTARKWTQKEKAGQRQGAAYKLIYNL